MSKTTVSSSLIKKCLRLNLSTCRDLCCMCLQKVNYDYLSLRVQWLGCIAGWEALAFCNSQEMGQDLAAVSLLLLFDHWPVVDCQVGSPCSVTLGAFREEKKKGRERRMWVSKALNKKACSKWKKNAIKCLQSKKYLPLTLIKCLMNIAATENSAKFSFKMSFDLEFLFYRLLWVF